MFIFYDTETSGLEKGFSQIFQMGLIFTDGDMNILSAKKIDCRRSPWVVPAPGAMLTTGFTPDVLKASKNSHFEMMQEVDQWIRAQKWPVVFSGYNTQGYDDEVLAANFHMNLLDPDTTTARDPKTGECNARHDLMVVVKAVQAWMPGALKLDIMNDQGYPSLKLMNVASQNGVALSADEAHDAMNDIRATVGVGKMLKKVAPDVWEHLLKLSTTDGVDDFIANNKVFNLTSVGRRNGSGNTELLFDLAYDPAPYMNMTVEQLKQIFIDADKKPAKGQPYPPKPFRKLRRSEQPLIATVEMAAPVMPKDFDEKLANARADALRANKQFQENLAEAARLAKEATAKAPHAHTEQPEEGIFNELQEPVKGKLEQWKKEFAQAKSWKDAAGLVKDFYTRFEKEMEEEPSIRRFVKFAGRIVFEHAPEELAEEKQEAMRRFIAAHILNPDTGVPWMTVAKARAELQKIEDDRASADPKKKNNWAHATDSQIRSLKLFYTALEKEYGPYLQQQPNAPVAPSSNDNAQQPATPPAEIKKVIDPFKP
jgi:exodeoxyribonuclease-1